MTRRPLYEHLERRWLLSAEDGAAAFEPPPMDSAPWDGTEIIATAIARLRQGPSPIPPDNKIQPAAVVGGTAATGRQPTGALTGHVVFAAAGHGFTAGTSTWFTQRGALLEMVEDLGNQDQMTSYVNYLFNAGATVVPMRPVGYQPAEVLIDNDDANVTYTGTWTDSTSPIYYGSPGDVPYRYASVNANETATARFTPNIPVAGFYPVYTWVKDDTDRIDQIYRVAHTGGISEVHVDHSHVGKGYVYLGTYFFNAGTSGYVEISNKGNNTGSRIVVADHIRFGNGIGDVNRGFGISGQTRSDEAALYWLEKQLGQGVDISVIRGGTIEVDQDDNVSAPPRFAAWMNREGFGGNDEIFLSYHSNAAGGRGVLGLYNGNNRLSAKTPHQFEWASLTGEEVNDDMVALSSQLEFAWFNQNNPTLDRSDIEFGEINNEVIFDEFDATIVEVAYHDNASDAALMRDPKVRDYVARASLQATIKYFRTYNSEPTLALPPDAPTNVRSIVQPNGDVTISWTAPVVDSIGGEAPTGYVVYKSADGLGFGNAIIVAGGGTLSYTIPAAQVAAGANFFRVAATNAGGESMPTEVVGNIKPFTGTAPILLVQGFDRLDKSQNPRQTTPTSGGYTPPLVPGTGNTFDRVRPRFSNSYDYVARTGLAIAAYNPSLGFDTTSNEAVIAGQVNLANYSAIIWLSGEESVANDTFNATEQTLITNFLAAGGKLFVSGSELGFDLENQGGGASFYNNQLKADYISDDANSYAATGSAGSIFAGISLSFDNGASGTYDVNTPDIIAPFGMGPTVAMTYSGSSSGAAVVHTSGTTGAKVVTMAFPFETITTAANRNAVMAAVLNFFGVTVSGGSIAGVVYHDGNGNGVKDGSEVNLGGGGTVYVDLDNDGTLDANEPSDVSDATGYLITNVPMGSRTLRLLAPTPVLVTEPASGSYSINVTGAMTGYSFGRFPIAFNGGTGNDGCYIRLDATGATIEIGFGLTPSIPPTLTIAKSKLTTLSYDGGAGDDTITIDCSNGVPIATFNATGGANTAAGDLVRIIGTSASDTVNVNGAAITLGSQTTNIAGIERIQVDSGSGDDALNQNAGTTAVVKFNGGASSIADTLNIAAGTYTFDADANVGTTNLAVVVASGASAAFNTTQHLGSLTVSGSAAVAAGGANVIVTKSLSVPGTLDLKDNKLIYDYAGESPMNLILPRLIVGRNGGAWNGAGIQSSTAGSSGLRGPGIAEASDVVGPSGGDWSGQSVDATALLIKYTYVGDFNLSGAIDADDYFRIDSSNGKPVTAYASGNADYNATIDGDDFFWIDANFLAQGAPIV